MRLLHACLLLALACAVRADTTYVYRLVPGTPAEAQALLRGAATSAANGARLAEAGGTWTWRLAAPPGARCRLSFTVQGTPAVAVAASDGRAVPSRIERAGETWTVIASAPPRHPLGAALRWTVRAGAEPVAVRDVRLAIALPDRSGTGVTDLACSLMGLAPGQRATVPARPNRPRTSFQTGDAYSPSIAAGADAVLAYTTDPAVMLGWAEKGYVLQTMGGFRDGAEYVKQHPGEVQTDRSGNPMVIGGGSYYLVPTQARIDMAKAYYAAAIAAGSTAVCPEEPEYFAQAGYSEAFKQEWQARYGRPWEPPHSSVDARYRSEQLKGFLERRIVEAVLEDARRLKPSVARMVAVHSPVTYYQWGIPLPHASLFSMPSLQEVIGQVWTGTARSPARAAGVRAERTFEVGYLEYSSLYNLLRGTGKRLWFLMDPVEDNPDRTMADYQANYEQTLLAALMFPPVDSFEVMPWPQRIYGRVPAAYATEVNSVVGVLEDLWRYPGGTLDAGSEAFGTFVSDSMGWQRADPAPSDFDGFYGLCLPLVIHGIPAQVLSLDRAAEPGYLGRTRVLLLSYDFLKPTDPAQNRALADWTRAGGTLLVFGGADAYNAVADSWWRRAGRASPLDDLFAQLGVSTSVAPQSTPPSAPPSAPPAPLSTVLSADGSVRDLRNRKPYTIDLTAYARAAGSAEVRFEDVSPQDGWGPYVVSAELRFGGRLAASFRAGSELETRFMSDERGTGFDGQGRFADRDSTWTYRFENLPRDQAVTLTLDMGNGFLVKAGPAGPRGPVLEAAAPGFDRLVQRLRLWPGCTLTPYTPPAGATTLWRTVDGGVPAVWETAVGKGALVFAGLPPGWTTATAQAGRWLRALARRAYERTGSAYKEDTAFIVRRGPYLAARTLGKGTSIDGRYVNLLSPTLAVVEDLEMPAHGRALLKTLGPERGSPRVVAVSGRLRASAEQARSTGFLAQAPAGTDGAARLWVGRRRLVGARGFTSLGAPVPVSTYRDGDTLLVRYPNDPDGVIVRLGWD